MLHELSTLSFGFKMFVEWKGWPPSKEEVTSPQERGLLLAKRRVFMFKARDFSLVKKRGVKVS